jgi:hypothetical protein
MMIAKSIKISKSPFLSSHLRQQVPLSATYLIQINLPINKFKNSSKNSKIMKEKEIVSKDIIL